MSGNKIFSTEIELYINGIDFIRGGANLIDCKIDEYAPYHLPLAELVIDCRNYALIPNIYDGAEVLIKFKVEDKETKYLKFRIMSASVPSYSTKEAIIRIGCYFDISKINYSTFYANEVPSYQVASYIANIGKLESNISTTNDKQTWLCYGKTLFDFLIDTSYNAWSNETSCMMACFSNNKLKYLNVSEQIQKKPVIKFFDNPSSVNGKSKDEAFYSSISFKFDSGVTNQIAGYGINGNNFNVISGNVDSINSNFKFKPVTEKTNLNSDLVKIQRSESLPTNCGNVHNNYYRAGLQNLRIKSLYSIRIDIMTEYLTDLELLDPVEVVVTNLENDINKQYSGKYVIERIRKIKDSTNSMFFIYSLCRPGVNVENNFDKTKLKLK